MSLSKKETEITLFYLSKRNNEIQANILYGNYGSHDLATRYSRIMENLRRDEVKILLEPIHDKNDKKGIEDLEYTRKLVNLVMSTGKLIKMDWARIDALIEADPRNMASLLNYMTDETGKNLMHELAQRKCMTIDECWQKLGFKSKLKFEKSYYFYELDLPKMWRDSKQTNFLKYVVNYYYGPFYTNLPGENRYNVKETIFLVPKKDLIIWDISTRYGGAPTLQGLDNIDNTGLDVFNGGDFLSQLPIFSGMKTAGIVKAGATKVPISVAKKISSLMTLRSLPKFEYTLCDRSSILADLGAYASPETISAAKKKNAIESASYDDNYSENLLRAMYGCIYDYDSKFLKHLLSCSASHLTKFAVDNLVWIMTEILKAIHPLMKNLPVSSENASNGAWVSIDNVLDYIVFEEANTGYWYSTIKFNKYDDVSKTENFSYPDFYPRFKLPIIQGIFQMLAAIGLLDMAYTKDTERPKLRYVRITNAGLWIANRIKELTIEMQKIDDGLHFDSESLMITISDTNSPNLALLDDLAEKVTNNRYKITESSILRDCKTAMELNERVKRLQKYLLDGEKSASLDLMIAKIYSKVNKVKHSTGDAYYCMDVDPDDKGLHKLLISNSQIRKNTLRVEGWKLLVKKSFYSTFLDKLRQAGYLTES